MSTLPIDMRDGRPAAFDWSGLGEWTEGALITRWPADGVSRRDPSPVANDPYGMRPIFVGPIGGDELVPAPDVFPHLQSLRLQLDFTQIDYPFVEGSYKQMLLDGGTTVERTWTRAPALAAYAAVDLAFDAANFLTGTANSRFWRRRNVMDRRVLGIPPHRWYQQNQAARNLTLNWDSAINPQFRYQRAGFPPSTLSTLLAHGTAVAPALQSRFICIGGGHDSLLAVRAPYVDTTKGYGDLTQERFNNSGLVRGARSERWGHLPLIQCAPHASPIVVSRVPHSGSPEILTATYRSMAVGFIWELTAPVSSGFAAHLPMNTTVAPFSQRPTWMVVTLARSTIPFNSSAPGPDLPGFAQVDLSFQAGPSTWLMDRSTADWDWANAGLGYAPSPMVTSRMDLLGQIPEGWWSDPRAHPIALRRRTYYGISSVSSTAGKKALSYFADITGTLSFS